MEGTRVFAGRRPFMPRKPAAARLTARTTRYTEPTQASRPSCFLRARHRGGVSARRPKSLTPDSSVRDRTRRRAPPFRHSRRPSRVGITETSSEDPSSQTLQSLTRRPMIAAHPSVRIRRGHPTGKERATAHAAHAIRERISIRGMIVRRRPQGPRPSATTRRRPSGVPTRGYRVPRRSDAAFSGSG